MLPFMGSTASVAFFRKITMWCFSSLRFGVEFCFAGGRGAYLVSWCACAVVEAIIIPHDIWCQSMPVLFWGEGGSGGGGQAKMLLS